MSGVNKVILVGRLGKDPELRYTASGKSVCNFSLATSEKYNDEEHTEWHNIQAWGKLAENCASILSRGKLAYIEGKIQTRKWEDKEGNTRYTTEIVANSMQVLDKKGESAEPKEPDTASPAGDGFDSDIPF